MVQDTKQKGRKPGKTISMHENVAVWCDCCSCEAEPYWQAVAGELGIDLDPPSTENIMQDKQTAQQN